MPCDTCGMRFCARCIVVGWSAGDEGECLCGSPNKDSIFRRETKFDFVKDKPQVLQSKKIPQEKRKAAEGPKQPSCAPPNWILNQRDLDLEELRLYAQDLAASTE